MGFIKETYSNGRAGLVVSFAQSQTSETFCVTDSVEEAMKHFGLFLDENNFLRIDSDSERAMDTLEIAPDQAKDFREKINSLVSVLDDETALNNIILFPNWVVGVEYKTGERIRYNNMLYSVLQDHTSQETWTPVAAASLYTSVLRETEDGSIPEWAQPESTNGFMAGDKVYHNGLLYVSTADYNTWEPGIEGNPWELVVEEQPEDTEPEVKEYAAGALYAMGDRVIFNGIEYESLIDNNSWSPADYPAGWAEVTE